MRICLVTTGQPSSNPRLVKEADALVGAGFEVRVIGAHWAEWADAADSSLLRDRGWSYTSIDWRRSTAPMLFWKSRLRHAAARATLGVPGLSAWTMPAAISRITPELSREAEAYAADLYIAHNLGALPAAARAAEVHGGRLGFDAEDFHRGQFAESDRSAERRAVEDAEATWLPRCDYVTAASEGIAAAYARQCARPPVTVLNVFPLDMRPAERPSTRPAGPLTLYWFSQTIGADRGLADVVRAMGKLPDGATELHLRGQASGTYRETLGDLARDAGVGRGRVHWHDIEAPTEMARLSAEYDAGLALEPGNTPNNDLAVSNKIFTYVLGGSAVIATATAGQRTIAAQMPDAAAVYAPGDIDGLVRILDPWVRDRAGLDAARRAAWDVATARFNWDLEQQRFLDVVKDVLATAAA